MLVEDEKERRLDLDPLDDIVKQGCFLFSWFVGFLSCHIGCLLKVLCILKSELAWDYLKSVDWSCISTQTFYKTKWDACWMDALSVKLIAGVDALPWAETSRISRKRFQALRGWIGLRRFGGYQHYVVLFRISICSTVCGPSYDRENTVSRSVELTQQTRRCEHSNRGCS